MNQNNENSLKINAVDRRPKTDDVTKTKGLNFVDFNLSRDLLKGIYEIGFEKPSPIQEESIPAILSGKHILARAKNGTGKTGAFTIPSLQKIDTEIHKIQVLILVPTRELATQTLSVVKTLAQNTNIRVSILTGGVSLKSDIVRMMKDNHVIVATPGRVLDLSRKEIINLSFCKIVVMDEADKLLSPDFVPIIENIIRLTHEKRQILLFSATFPLNVKSFSDKWMRNSVQINLMDELTLKGVSQFYVFLEERQKVHCLRTLFTKLAINQTIIFCNSVKRVRLLADKILSFGYSCCYIHSKMEQNERNRIFHDFRNGSSRQLICTDLFTRGIDIQSVNVVINFDFPSSSDTYLHRIGRSGRFGHLGLAINFITNNDRTHFYKVEKELEVEIPHIPPKDIDKALYVSR